MTNKLNSLKKIILIAGPTASGKSKLGIRIANKINGEIINADSMQIYKEFLILSSRPSLQDEKKIKHHLYGILSVKKYFSVGNWLVLVKKKVNEIIKRKKTPIIVGGTGLYFKAVTKGIGKIPEINLKFRKKIRDLHSKIGQKEFYKKLILIDPKSKKNISPEDTQRSIRAYEVKLFTKKSLYDWFLNTQSDFLDYDLKKFYIDIPRDILLKKIEKRTNSMFKNNCMDEVKNFLRLKIDKSLTSNKLIGVKEINDYLDGFNNLKQTKELINIRTRQYAKRQNTWSRGHMKLWKMIYSKNTTNLVNKILKEIS